MMIEGLAIKRGKVGRLDYFRGGIGRQCTHEFEREGKKRVFESILR